MKNLSILIIVLVSIGLASCTGGTRTPPNLKNTDNGVVVIPVKISNTSREDFSRYFKIYPQSNPDLGIVIMPSEGEYFIFSPEMPAGVYNFNRIKLILRPDFESPVHSAEKIIKVSTPVEVSPNKTVMATKVGIPVEIKPRSLTIVRERFVVTQYNMKGPESDRVTRDLRFESIPDSEMKSVIKEVKKIGGVDQWNIANEL